MGKIVYIRLEDLCHSSGWTPVEMIPKGNDLECTAVGFLITEDEKTVTIAQAIGRCSCEEVLNPFTIPKVNIKEMKELVMDG